MAVSQSGPRHNGSVSRNSVPLRQDHLTAAISTGRSTPDSAEYPSVP